jgi:hypothetical protein
MILLTQIEIHFYSSSKQDKQEKNRMNLYECTSIYFSMLVSKQVLKGSAQPD